MKPGQTTLTRIAAVLTLLLAGAASLAAQSAQEQDSKRYARIARAEVHVRNLPDVDGVSIATPAKGSIVTIHGEKAGWYQVEIPGGYPAWVFGRYVRAIDEDGVFEVTRNAVNVRPKPSDAITSFPLPQRMHAGDRARLIEVLDPNTDLASTWVRIWTPPGVRAWLRASDTEPLAAEQDGQVLWAQALDGLSERVVPPYERPGAKKPEEVATTDAAATKPAESEAEKKAREGIEEARRMLEVEIEKDTPDLGGVRAKLETLLATAPSGAAVAEVRAELARLANYEELARLRAELERERTRRAEEARRRQQEAWEASVAKDPLGHVFLSRGVLLREIHADGTPHYFLRFGKDKASELVCASGRYDLDVFAAYEIGVQGDLLVERDAGLPVIEVRRLEIIARR